MNSNIFKSLIVSLPLLFLTTNHLYADADMRPKLILGTGGHCVPAKGSCKKCTNTTFGLVSESPNAKHSFKIDAAFNRIILHKPASITLKSQLKTGGKTVSTLSISCDPSKRCSASKANNLTIPTTQKYTLTTEAYSCTALNRQDPSGRVDTDAELAAADREDPKQDPGKDQAGDNQTPFGNEEELTKSLTDALTKQFTQNYYDVMNSYDDHLPANASMADKQKAYYEFMLKMQRGEVKFKQFGLEDLNIGGLNNLKALGNSIDELKIKYPDWQKLTPTQSEIKDLQGLGQTLQSLKQKYPNYKGGPLNQQQLNDLKQLGAQIKGLQQKYPDWKRKIPTAQQTKDLQALGTQFQNALKANPGWTKNLTPEQKAGLKKWQNFTNNHQKNQAENKKKWDAFAKKWQENHAKNQKKNAENKKKWEAFLKKQQENKAKNQKKRAEDKKKWDEFVKNLQKNK